MGRKQSFTTQDSRWSPIREMAICRKCKGQCCYVREMVVLLDKEQADRTLHQYRYEKREVRWRGSMPVLKKRKDGSCVYYDREKRKCSIYERRPRSCKAFFCGRGRKQDAVWQRLLEEERRRESCPRTKRKSRPGGTTPPSSEVIRTET